jgi:16S rRNA (cytosine1402-N4)-methyltransferase
MTKRPHIPIMENEMAQTFAESELKVYVDGTVGAGGHAKRILEEHPEIETFIGFDQDPEALAIARETLAPWKDKVKLIHCNFVDFDKVLKEEGIEVVDGFFFDLGVSSMQLDNDYKGFSFLKEGPLDMRMNPLNELSAEEVVNKWSEKDLGDIFREYGEDPRWKAAARIVVEERRKGPITTTKHLADLLEDSLRSKIRGRLHPATLVFQGLRVFVNKELEVLEIALAKVISFLAPKGIVGVISFQSFEDRIVKNIFREAARPLREKGKKLIPVMELLTKKPLVATLKEVRQNSRSRSAKLRFARKN